MWWSDSPRGVVARIRADMHASAIDSAPPVHSMARRSAALRITRIIAAAALCGSLAHCGFHVRGDTQVPFATLAVVGAEGTSLVVELKRTIRGNAKVSIVDKPEQADAVLYILTNQNDKSILTLSGGGRVREFQLTQKIIFRVADINGNEWLPASEISVRRDFSFNDSQALAKEGEERLLLADMQADAVQQMMRRLSTAKRPA